MSRLHINGAHCHTMSHTVTSHRLRPAPGTSYLYAQYARDVTKRAGYGGGKRCVKKAIYLKSTTYKLAPDLGGYTLAQGRSQQDRQRALSLNLCADVYTCCASMGHSRGSGVNPERAYFELRTMLCRRGDDKAGICRACVEVGGADRWAGML